MVRPSRTTNIDADRFTEQMNIDMLSISNYLDKDGQKGTERLTARAWQFQEQHSRFK